MKNTWFTVALTVLLDMGTILAQCSIGNPTTDNPTLFTNSMSIEANFTAARRWEETNRGLTPNCLGNFDAPSGGWSGMSYDEIVFYIHNEERVDRGLLPFHGIETGLDAISQAHTDWMMANDVFSHTGNPALGTGASFRTCPNNFQFGSSIQQRIESDPDLDNCWDTWAENISASVAPFNYSFPNFVAASVYDFLYVDGACCGWGHRENVLMNLADNWGDNGTEGFLGVGVTTGSNYAVYDFSCDSYTSAILLCVNYYDPKSSCSNFSFSLLPADILSFTVTEADATALLAWKVANETNVDYYEVERSEDGIVFTPLHQIAAVGNGKDFANYDYADPLENINATQLYYRLATVDYDHSKHYSTIKTLSLERQKKVTLYPNPATDWLYVPLDAAWEQTDFRLVYPHGQVSLPGTTTQDEIIRLDVRSVPAGVFVLQYKDARGGWITLGKMVKK
ncbi:MAG: hypothetical protein R2795_07715 [Saprospiraceae bacterium]